MPRVTGPTSAGMAALMPYFNSILGAVEQGANVAGLWQAVRNASELTGGYIQGATIFDMNAMAGYARSILSSEGGLARAAPGDAVDSTMWAWAPWAAGETDSWLQDRYQVRYQVDVVGPNGEPGSVWGTWSPEGSLSGLTAGDVEQAAQLSGQNILDTYDQRALASLGIGEGYSMVGVSRIQIMRL